MVVENTASQIGDVLLITSTSPLVGIVQFTGWTDFTTGENATRYFKKEFSYSTDGIFFSPWLDLTTANVVAIQVNSTDYFYVTYKYTRVGTDNTGLLEFQEVDLLGIFEAPTCANYTVLPQSIFNDIFCYNPRQIYLCGKLTKKLYDKGIVPEYVTRGETSNPKVDDRDYLDFWDAVCCFFALIIIQAEKLENVAHYPKLLADYVRQKGLYFCNDISQADLIYLMNNSFDQVSKRGTVRVFKQADQIVQIDGEFLRLICFDAFEDEFLYSLVNDEHHGYDIDQSSPMYAGVPEMTNLIKGYELSESLENLSSYPINNPTYVGVAQDPLNPLRTGISIENVPANSVAGVGYNNFANPIASTNLGKAILVDPNLDYEITLELNQQLPGSNITFGCLCLDAYGNVVDPYVVNNLGAQSRFFFQTQNMPQLNVNYHVRGILYNSSQGQLSVQNSKLNTGFGSNLVMHQRTLKVLPFVLVDYSAVGSTTTNRTYVFNFKLRPLVFGQCANEQTYLVDSPSVPLTNDQALWRNSTTGVYYTYNQLSSNWEEYTGNLSDYLLNLPMKGAQPLSFIGVKNTIALYCKNNNGALTLSEIKKIADRYLIPHDSLLKLVDLQGLYND